MIIYAAPPIFLQLLLPLFSLILMASYFKEFVIVWIGVIMLANMAVLSLPCFKKKLYCDIQYLYDSKDENRKRWEKESDEIFYTAILTSWISPCTVWSNNNKFKSNFLFINSLITFNAHLLFGWFIPIISEFKWGQSKFEFPTIIQCFENQENISLR